MWRICASVRLWYGNPLILREFCFVDWTFGFGCDCKVLLISSGNTKQTKSQQNKRNDSIQRKNKTKDLANFDDEIDGKRCWITNQSTMDVEVLMCSFVKQVSPLPEFASSFICPGTFLTPSTPSQLTCWSVGVLTYWRIDV